MEIIFQALLAGFIASIVWFIVGGIVYMNPIVAGIYKKFKSSPGLKNWKNTKSYLINTYVFAALIQCLIFSLVYLFIKPVLPGTLEMNTLFFGLVLVGVKIIPRLFDMWMQSTYPNKLLGMELINGIIGSFVIALVLVLMI